LGVPAADLARPAGGAVFIFKGTAQGLPAAPTWTLTGSSDTAQFGAVLAAGDLDGDGKAELAVAAPGSDITATDSGAVYLYAFDSNGPKALRNPLTGLGRGRFGTALAIADLDGDGDNDLAVGSPTGDLAPTATMFGRGVVDLFLIDRLKPIPDLGAIRLGGVDLATDGTTKATTNLNTGRSLAIGDF